MIDTNSIGVNIQIKEDPLPETPEELGNGLTKIFLKYQSLIRDYPEFNYNMQNDYNQYLTRLLDAGLIEAGLECLIRGGVDADSDGQALMKASMQCSYLRDRDTSPTYNNDRERQTVYVDDGEGGIYQFPYTNNPENVREVEMLLIYKGKRIKDLTKIWKGRGNCS